MREGNTMEKKALVIIDIQNDITKSYKEIIGTIKRVIHWALEHENNCGLFQTQLFVNRDENV